MEYSRRFENLQYHKFELHPCIFGGDSFFLSPEKYGLRALPDDGDARSLCVGDEGTGIASDVVKMEGEDPAIPSYYLRSVVTRKLRDRNNSPLSG